MIIYKLNVTGTLFHFRERNHKAILVSQGEHYLKDLSDISKTVKPEQIS